jgi:hypothetical protein
MLAPYLSPVSGPQHNARGRAARLRPASETHERRFLSLRNHDS